MASILKLTEKRQELPVVEDQKGSPTSTRSLSRAIERLIITGAHGIYHFTDETGGGIPWYEFAREIVRLSGRRTAIVPIATDRLPRPARRPSCSVLDISLFTAVTGYTPADWKTALKEYLEQPLSP